ncbi:MAG TPA: DNA polymerase Y family protein [Microvirga sp.]|jgi:protein ImuB|nr:DNA polymerase Y family protein [Microvirga sp.]
MRRVVSLYLPTWPTDRIRRRYGAPPPDQPLITALKEGSRRLVAAVDATAHDLGLRPGLTLTHAKALVPDLHVFEASPEDDGAALVELARWCIGYSPLVAPNPPDGVWLDVTGVTHLFGGEEKLIDDLVGRLDRQGVAALAAVADAPGCAWAVARYGKEKVVAPGRSGDAVASLPVQALRLPADTVDALHRLGVERIGQLAALARAPMVRRFGTEAALRLDQALGHAFEPIDPLVPREIPTRRAAFADPIGRPEDIRGTVGHLAEELCRDLEKRGEGVRRLDLILQRVDHKSFGLRVGTARASRDPEHLAGLFDERLQTVDPGFGIEAVVLVASRVEPLRERQTGAHALAAKRAPQADMSRLVDRLGARLGPKRVYRLEPVQSAIPERSVRRVPALAPATKQTWPASLPRPTRLLDPPERVEATALLPDHPPAFFVWRRVRHRIAKADGPERITGEWWVADDEKHSLRDYYRVENDKGVRFWLFRDGPADQGGRWWLHGIFE